MKDVLYYENNEFNEITLKNEFIKIKKSDEEVDYHFDKIDFTKSFNTNVVNDYVEINFYIDNQEVLFMVKKSNFLKFKEILNQIKSEYMNTDFTLNNRENFTYNPSEDDNPNPVFAIVGFFLPLVGFIIWAVLVNTKPKTAKTAGIGGIIGFIVNIILWFYLWWYVF